MHRVGQAGLVVTHLTAIVAAAAVGGCGSTHSLGTELPADRGGAAGGAAVSAQGGGSGGAEGGVAGTAAEPPGGAHSGGGPQAPLSMGGSFPTAQETARKLDLLFVVDNSISMADKQALLEQAVPPIVHRLVNPLCVDATGTPVSSQPAAPSEPCPGGSERELAPMRDAHIGIISSSLGGHGGPLCTPDSGQNFDPTQDDRAHLLPPLRGLSSPFLTAEGYYVWDGAGSIAELSADIATGIAAVGERGCGFESTNEAWYRFLVDPSPPASVPTVTIGGVVQQQGTDTELLAQRAAFLRPDSALMIVVLSDENDCSIKDEGASWLVASAEIRMPRARAICETDPNDRCCSSCADLGAEAECGPASGDPSCALRDYTSTGDPLNLRCFQQQRRFGIDLLHPIDRYVRGLTARTVLDDDGAEVDNPIYAGGRHPSLVSYVGIVGVPWQALAADTATDAPLRFKPTEELHAEGAWPALVGVPETTTVPEDPFLRESVEPRSGMSPVTALAVASSDAPGGASPINGHEYVNSAGDDLQYACVFPLATPRECSAEYEGVCDCMERDGQLPDRPLCQAPGSTTFTTTQYYAKAYPGLRHLAILQRIGRLAVPASICPRESIDTTAPDYGYAPIADSIIERLSTIVE